MKFLSSFGQFVFESENQAAECNYYEDAVSKGELKPDEGYYDFWAKYEKMPDPEKKAALQKISKKIAEYTDLAKKEYKNWYSLPGTVQKFKAQGDAQDKRRQLMLNYINGIEVKVKTKPSANDSDWFKRSWAYFLPSDPKNIWINLYNFNNGDALGDANLRTAIKHEIGHAIDNFLTQGGVRVYLATHPKLSPEEYQKQYLAQDKDQFTRLSVFRGIINANPMDTAQGLLDKFMAKVKDGTITSPKYNFSTARGGAIPYLVLSPKNQDDATKALSEIPSEDQPVQEVKNTQEESQSVYKFLVNSLEVSGKFDVNLTQLFCNYSRVKKDFPKGYAASILVNFEDIASQNRTTVDVGDQNAAPETGVNTGYQADIPSATSIA